jgi:hypothetical protein
VPIPPRIVRRLILAPLGLVLSLALLALSPVALVTAAITDLFRSRRWQTLRVVAFVAVYLLFEVIGLLALLGLWIAGGFRLRSRSERIQEAHYGFMRWWLGGMNRAVALLFRLRITVEDRPDPRAGPVLVFSRHAGPGNSLMLIGTLMIAYQRRPRIVMLAKLQWEPMFDVMLNRLPNRFIQHDPRNRQRYLDAIGDLARGIGERDAFVLFPEGRDFTPRLRLRAIDYLRKKGHLDEAEKAEEMTRVLPPRHGGVMAAIMSSPQADVVFVAHTVLEDIGSFRELWRRIPFEAPILARYWRVPPEQIPHEQEALIDWLYIWWGRIDDWIEARRASPGITTNAPRPRR